MTRVNSLVSEKFGFCAHALFHWFYVSRKKIFDYLCNRVVFLFFFSRPFHENFKFSKPVHTIFIKFCSHYTSKGAPACAKASKSYGWNVRNVAKISPKMDKISPKKPLFDFFSDFLQKLSIRFKRNFLQSFYTILES